MLKTAISVFLGGGVTAIGAAFISGGHPSTTILVGAFLVGGINAVVHLFQTSPADPSRP